MKCRVVKLKPGQEPLTLIEKLSIIEVAAKLASVGIRIILGEFKFSLSFEWPMLEANIFY